MPTQGTYFLNDTVWASGNANTATNIYTEATLTTAAPNGWYKDNNNVYREVTGGTGALGPSAACTSCGTAIALFSLHIVLICVFAASVSVQMFIISLSSR